MKIRIFQNMSDSIYFVLVNTEDWSQDDMKLMCRFGEPEVDAGGEFSYEFNGETKTKNLGSFFVRIMHGFPYRMGFDSRDYGSFEEAEAAGKSWKDSIVGKIEAAIGRLRSNPSVLPQEEVIDNV